MPTYGLGGDEYPPITGAAPRQSAPSQPSASTAKSNGGPIQNPGNNLVNQGYTEQTFEHLQNQFMDDPYAAFMNDLAQKSGNTGSAENYMLQNLGTLHGPGEGSQYWNQVQGQFNDPFAGEQFTREATQNFQASGPASAFYNQAMGQYDDFTGYTGPQNTQGAYGNAQSQLGNGTIGQQNMQQLAGQYDSMGQYTDPNLAAGQYGQTQQAFGDMPIANFDPFFDRARQLGVQSYNQGAAGRGVYGSSEALSGVGNVITDIEAQRALKGFDAEMQRAQEQRMRQQLLGEQARMGDLSSLAAFGANLSGVETFGNLNNQMGQLQNNSQEILGTLANYADSQALGAQNSNIAGLNAFSQAANNADTAETDRYEASTTAMNNADRTGIDRMTAGADIANMVDDNEREDYTAGNNAARDAANVRNDRLRTAGDIADAGSDNYRGGLNDTMNAADMAENDRQDRQNSYLNHSADYSSDVMSAVSSGLNAFFQGDQAAWENSFQASIAPKLQAAGFSQQQIESVRQDATLLLSIPGAMQALGNSGGSGWGDTPIDTNNPYG